MQTQGEEGSSKVLKRAAKALSLAAGSAFQAPEVQVEGFAREAWDSLHSRKGLLEGKAERGSSEPCPSK